MAALTLAVLVAVHGCFSTRGKSVRYSGRSLVIFPLIVLALYSSLGDATQQGTILWASTYTGKLGHHEDMLTAHIKTHRKVM